jgi:hypothetical protein
MTMLLWKARTLDGTLLFPGARTRPPRKVGKPARSWRLRFLANLLNCASREALDALGKGAGEGTTITALGRRRGRRDCNRGQNQLPRRRLNRDGLRGQGQGLRAIIEPEIGFTHPIPRSPRDAGFQAVQVIDAAPAKGKIRRPPARAGPRRGDAPPYVRARSAT